MKKLSIFSACMAMVAMLASCEQKEQNLGSGLVKFQILSNETKATVVTTESINTPGNEFVVDLFNTETKESVASGLTAECVATDGGTDWELTPMTYWEWRTLDAWAHYPKTLKAGSISAINSFEVNAERTTQAFNFCTYFGSANDADMQDDLLFACTKNTPYTQNNGHITLLFAHALSAVYFRVVVDEAGLESGEEVVLNSLELKGVKRAGSCVYNPSLEDAARFAWDVTEGGSLDRMPGSYVQTFDQPLTANCFLGGTSFETANCFFVIPQVMTEAAALTVNWTKNGVQRDPRTAQIFKDKNGNVVTWKAGYKYLYTLKIKNKGADVEVDVKVLPWDYNESNIEFGETVSSTNPLTFDAATANIEGSNVVFKQSTTAVKGQFLLGTPKDGQWVVSLTNSQDFDLYEMSSTGLVKKGALMSGAIDPDQVAEFYILPKAGISATVDHETKVLVSAVRADGETISADEQLGNNYTIILTK